MLVLKHFPILIGAKLCLGGRGHIYDKNTIFSGKTAEKVMGVYGFDCPAIFWDQECSHFLGVGRGCNGALTRPSTRHILPKNFEKTALRKRVGIFTEITVPLDVSFNSLI